MTYNTSITRTTTTTIHRETYTYQKQTNPHKPNHTERKENHQTQYNTKHTCLNRLHLQLQANYSPNTSPLYPNLWLRGNQTRAKQNNQYKRPCPPPPPPHINSSHDTRPGILNEEFHLPGWEWFNPYVVELGTRPKNIEKPWNLPTNREQPRDNKLPSKQTP